MFPNFRLMIAAVAASVVALSCGFGVFAALRVNHEPLARLPAATAPLQLVPDKVAGPALLSASPSPVGEPEIAAAAPDVPAGESAPHESDQTPSAASAAEPEAVASIAEAKTETAAQPADPPVMRSGRAGTGACRCRQRRHIRGLGRSGGCRSGRHSKYREAGRHDR
jgi:hypothetical protein